MREQQISTRHYQLSAVISGQPDQPPIIALHGWLDNAASFHEIRQYFPDHYFIALDLVGHGRSDHRPAGMPYYLWDNVADVLDVLDTLGLDQVTLLGHSMGASIATLFAASFPERVAQLWLIEGLAPLVYEEVDLPALMAEAIVKRRRMQDKRLKPYPDRESAVEARMNGRWPVSYQAAESLIARGMTKTSHGYIWSSDPGLLLPSIVRMSEKQVRSFLQKVACPVRLYMGTEGLWDSHWEARVGLMSEPVVLKVEGNHHLHLAPEAARIIAEDLLEHDIRMR